MKVLEPGTRIGVVGEFRCTAQGNGNNGCNALLEVGRTDLRWYPPVSNGGYGDRDPAISFRCPECEEITDLTSDRWPRRYTELTEYSRQWHDTGIDARVVAKYTEVELDPLDLSDPSWDDWTV